MLLRCVNATHFHLPDGRVLGGDHLAAELPAGACTVLLPASLASITEVAVGVGEAALLRKTLPWRLEESLLSTPETLHFAHSDVSAGRAAVTLVDKAALQLLRTTLMAVGLSPTAIYAELSLVPWQPRQWSVWVQPDSDELLVRHGWHRGFACTTNNLAATLTLLQNEQQQWPEQIVVYAAREQAAAIQATLPGPLQSLAVVRKQPAWDELVKAQAIPCNVLQGSFAPPLPWQRWCREWRLAAGLVIALVLSDGIFTAASTRQLRAQQEEMEAQIVSLYRQAQPQGQLVDPVLQLQELLSRNGGNRQRLLPLLSRMAQVLATEPGSTVEALDFDTATGELQLELRSASLTGIESLRSKLQSVGLVAELVGSSSEGNTSRARLRVVGS